MTEIRNRGKLKKCNATISILKVQRILKNRLNWQVIMYFIVLRYIFSEYICKGDREREREKIVFFQEDI